jgi:hypothetical protein
VPQKFTSNSFIVKLIDKCRKTVIKESAIIPNPIYYQVGEPMISVPFLDWTHTYTQADCGPFYYTLTSPRTAFTLVLTAAPTFQEF